MYVASSTSITLKVGLTPALGGFLVEAIARWFFGEMVGPCGHTQYNEEDDNEKFVHI